VPCTRTRTLRFRRSAKSTIAAGSAVALTVPLVPLLFVSSIVLTVSRPVHFPICPGIHHGRRHSAAVFPPLVLLTNSCFFDVGSFCAARGNFPRLRRLPARQWSYHCTGRSSSTYWAMRGIIFIHFAGGHPFPLQSSLPRDVSRLALVWRREKLSSGPVHAPMPPALPHAHSRRRISWNLDTPIAFEAHKLMIA
jgi:hypothetical protein